MSRVYLIRHGQAGLRHNYDTLSDVGILQAQSLGEWFRREKIAFDEVISGGLARQMETARHAARAPEVDVRLDEFDLDAVYRELAPRLCEDDPDFRLEYETMLVAMQSHDAPVHRRWTGSDVKVFQAWQSGRFSYDGESWAGFKQRVLGFLDVIRCVGPRQHWAAFTSATPIGLLVAQILGSDDTRAMRMAGSCYNSSVTTLRVHEGDISLIGFNSIAHLSDPALRTFR